MVTITIHTPNLERKIAALSEARLNEALARSLNRSGDSVKVFMVRSIAANLGVSQSEALTRGRSIKDMVKVRPATPNDLRAVVSTDAAERIPLATFKASGPMPSRGKGAVSARVQGSRKRYPGAFLARMGSGHVGVFKRTSTKRLPITELFGPSPWKVFQFFKGLGQVRGREQLRKEIASAIRFALTRR